MRPTAHEELTDEENERFLATLTPAAWVGLTVEAITADWFRLDTDLSYLEMVQNPAERLVHEARLSSGSINGDARRDLKEAIVGSPAQQSNISVPIINGPQGSPNGQPTTPPKPRRGF